MEAGRISMAARLLALLLAFASWPAPANAQPISVPGEPAVAAKAASALPRLRLPAHAPAHRSELSDISPQAVAEVRMANRRGPDAQTRTQLKRVVIGVVRDARAERPARLAWTAVEGGHAARIAVRSPAAESMRLALELEGVPAQVEMVFFGSADASRLEGPIRVGDVADRSAPWWTPVTEGDEQTVELFAPAGTELSIRAIAVSRASHLVTTPAGGLAKRLQDIGASGSCNVDVPCASRAGDAAFRNAAASVAQMVFTDGSFTALCTGSLLNDADPASQVPYFYSANHCFDNEQAPHKTPAQLQAVAASLTTLWDFEADACVAGRGSGRPRAGWSQLARGATVLYSDVASDALLLRLNDTPPVGAFYSGWDASPIASGSSITGIHHPQGDLKKVSEGAVRGFASPGLAGSYIEVGWGSGTTEGGSSGSGLWTPAGSQYLFRGGLWGGSALCGNPSGSDFYSRFDRVYPSISRYLGASAGGGTDYTDLWWNPDESGWGLNLIQHPSRVIFGVWYTYAADGKRTWFVLPTGTWTSPTTYTGALYETAGPNLAQSFDASKVRVNAVGTATLTFTDADHGTFEYTVHGVGGRKPITRQPF